MKRSFDFIEKACLGVYANTRSKKPRLSEGLTHNRRKPIPISATHTRNYIMNDPLVDWLNLYSKSKGHTKGSTQFISFLMNQGNKFEKNIVAYINDNITPVVSVSDIINERTCNETIKLMNAGTPVIHSAPVYDKKTHTRGIIDLLVRSDYLKMLVRESPISDVDQSIEATGLSCNGEGPPKYHYVVIDVKFSTLPLRADGKFLLNSGSYPAYKVQLWIYNQAIGRIQGYTPRYAFILGRRWRYTSKDIKYSCDECLDKLGVVDYQELDETYIQRTEDAIKWVRRLRKYGGTWKINPPTVPELYPNMCVDSLEWNDEKQRIAQSIGEITNVWYVGVKDRDKALKNGINSWKSPRCTSQALGISGKRAPIIDKIMEINRHPTDKIWPKKIQTNIHNWKTSTNEMFVDFETISDVFGGFSNLPKQGRSDMIFMIGVGWVVNGEWKYKSFICNDSTYDEEYRIMDEFNTFRIESGNPKMYYWCAEQGFWSAAENRQFDINTNTGGKDDRLDNISNNWKDMRWADLNKVFTTEPVVINGCFKFGLKNIANAMRNHGMISATIESACDSGMSAMVKAWECYQKEDEPSKCDIMKDIEKYNEFDCKALCEIITYLRSNHI